MSVDTEPDGGAAGMADGGGASGRYDRARMAAARARSTQGQAPALTAEAAGYRDGGIDVMAVLGALRRRKVLILTTVAVVTSLTVLATLQISPRYTATAAVMIAPAESRVANMKSMIEGTPASLQEQGPVIATQLRILESRLHAQRVIESLSLLHDPEFNRTLRSADGGIERLVRTWLPETWLVGSGFANQAGASDELTEPGADGDAPHTEAGTGNADVGVAEAVTDRFLARLKVKQEGQSHVLSVSFTSLDPKKAAEIANAAIQAYIESQLDAKIQTTNRAIKWVSDRLMELREQLLRAERAIEEYRAAEDLVGGRDGSLEAQQLAALTTALINARAERMGRQAILNQVREVQTQGSGYQSLTQFASSPALADLRRRELELRREEAQLSTEYGQRHPLVLRVRAEKEEIAGKVDEEIRSIIRNLENELAVARGREQALEQSVEEAKGRSALAGQAAIQLRELEREAAARRSVYEAFLTRLNELREQRDLLEPDAKVVSVAAVPDGPSFPKLKIMTAIGFTGSLILGVLLAAVGEHLDRGLRTGRQVEQVLGLPTLGLVPTIDRLKRRQTPHRYLLDRPLSAYAEAIKAVETALRFSDFGAPQVVLVTSALPSEGKTTLAMSLGASAARSGRKTLVMDLDLRHPSIARELMQPVEADLVQFLCGEQRLDEIILNDPSEPNLDVISVRNRTASPGDILSSQKMSSLLAELRHRYEYIVLDAPPTLGHIDAKVAALLADAVLFVVRWHKTSETVALNGVEALVKTYAPLAGVVLTQVKLRHHVSYGYGDVGQYYGERTKYYLN